MQLSDIGKGPKIQTLSDHLGTNMDFAGESMIFQTIKIDKNEEQTLVQAAPSQKYQTIQEWLEKEPNIRINQFMSAFPLSLNVLKDKNKDIVAGYLQKMSLKQVKQQKRRIKDHLRAYDNDFMAQFGRFPQNFEKSPIQAIYIYYKMVKQQHSIIADSQAAEKKQINQKRAALKVIIKEYQVGFEASHGRKIEHKRDIKPIYEIYKEYKKLKKQL